MSSTAHTRCDPDVRPLVPYEPADRRRPRRAGAGRDQLVLPAARQATADTTIPEPGQSVPARVPPPPGRHALRSLLLALTEVTAGQRYPAQLRAEVGEAVYRMLQRPPWRPPGARYVFGPVHGERTGTHTLHVCATAHGPAHALAALARMDARWHGWVCTRFELLLSPAHRHRAAGTASASGGAGSAA
ncbi:Rv3235 family protein [Haloechinothrix sp. LS1_15]|uniref:Rv3235 family protein n=1 Tax=Haloechinothrix sp. LS1_15 TaxID=2652248 RepID=UPI002946D533|nr:Rv3235 family protein [Haloechinothrix sp. LS1_15]MDV6011576.1 hypothetical protein [Haloechinothrix sp. LS1_15]